MSPSNGARRYGISTRTRFKVFERDNFTCQYCGIWAPDVVLHVDHIKPVSRGGTNDMRNLVTACRDCNAGKGNSQLFDEQFEIECQDADWPDFFGDPYLISCYGELVE